MHPDLPEYTVTLQGEAPGTGGPVAVRTLVIRKSRTDEPVQRIDGLAAEPPREALVSGSALQVLDMNFDGYDDFRIMEVAPAGPNVRYLHWIYEPDSELFAGSPALDALTSTSFDAKTRQITSTERKSPIQYSSETYEYSGDRLVLVRKTVKYYSEPGRYRLTVSEPVDGRMQIIDQRLIDER